MEQALFSIPLDQLEPIIKGWVKEVIEQVQAEKPAAVSEERLTREELAKYLNVSLPTIDRYRANGVFAFYQTGRTIYFKKAEVDEALKVETRKRKLR